MSELKSGRRAAVAGSLSFTERTSTTVERPRGSRPTVASRSGACASARGEGRGTGASAWGVPSKFTSVRGADRVFRAAPGERRPGWATLRNGPGASLPRDGLSPRINDDACRTAAIPVGSSQRFAARHAEPGSPRRRGFATMFGRNFLGRVGSSSSFRLGLLAGAALRLVFGEWFFAMGEGRVGCMGRDEASHGGCCWG